jgi:ADP-heptose:LPS heptosyltransferase
MERLLCVKIASRGDLLLAGPAFRWLRASRPGARLALAVGKSCLEVGRHLPFFDEVHAVDDARLLAGGLAGRCLGAAELLRLMRRRGGDGGAFGSVFLFHRDRRFAALARLSGIPERRGFDPAGSRAFLTHPARAGEREHHVSQYLRMVGAGDSADGSMEGVWKFGAGELEAASAAAAALGLDPGGRAVVLAFGGGRNVKTRTALKSWPLERWRELARRLAARGLRVAWVGDAEDAAALRGGEEGVRLAGRLGLAESAGVVARAALVVANDSFMLHLAGALGVPAVGIFGPTDPEHYRPRSPRSRTLWAGEGLECSPCHRDGWFPECRHEHRCMRDLSVEAVLGACQELLP